MHMSRFNTVWFAILVLSVISLTGCQQLTINTEKLVKSDVELKEIIGLVAGFGTTFAALPDLIAMLKRRSSLGINPRMGAITGSFQILWVYYGLLIASRPVILWNVIAVVVNFLTVGAYTHFLRKEKQAHAMRARTRASA
jgi:MtN3 and saliva related transmembrane protein